MNTVVAPETIEVTKEMKDAGVSVWKWCDDLNFVTPETLADIYRAMEAARRRQSPDEKGSL
jgi:hypothetical protein